MRKNPFSIYDFLGYVFPGILGIYIILIFTQDNLYIGTLTDLYKVGKKILTGGDESENFFTTIEATIILTVLAYVLGHLIAYLSSITIEPFSNWVYGFPSKYLLGIKRKITCWDTVKEVWKQYKKLSDSFKKYHKHKGNKYSRKTVTSSLRKFFSALFGCLTWTLLTCFLLPISLGTFIVHRILRLKKLVTRPLDKVLKQAILLRSKDLEAKLGIDLPHQKTDVHRVIYHYVYENMGTHSPKLDNYVALYGFLRSLTFISNCVFIALFWLFVKDTIDFRAQIDWGVVRLMIFAFFITYVFFLAFEKFYRRFTLESLMCLLTCDAVKPESERSEIRPLIGKAPEAKFNSIEISTERMETQTDILEGEMCN